MEDVPADRPYHAAVTMDEYGECICIPTGHVRVQKLSVSQLSGGWQARYTPQVLQHRI